MHTVNNFILSVMRLNKDLHLQFEQQYRYFKSCLQFPTQVFKEWVGRSGLFYSFFFFFFFLG